MKILQTKINKINWDKDFFYIICDDKLIIKIKIIDGTIETNIKNKEGELVSFTMLEKNDIIKVFYKKEKDNYIYPEYILTNTKYTFDSDSTISDNNI